MSARALANRAHWIAISITVFGAGVLVYWLAVGRPLWVDEEMLALNVRDRSLTQLAGPLWLNQSAPFGWLVVEHLAMQALGTSEAAVRLLPICFAIGTLVVAAWVGRRWMTPFGAAILVSLFVFAEWYVFFILELKHYSGDAFWALLLPALAAWSLDLSRESSPLLRTAGVWWLLAAVGVWFGNGAVFVAPGCAVALVLVWWRRAGWRGAFQAAAPAVVWFASFAANYFFVLRHALANPVLKDYWAFAFPPVGDGVAATLAWLATLPATFAGKPASSALPFQFWIACAFGLGVAIVRRQMVGVMFATVPLAALVLAFLHVVPTFERLSLWVVPSLYVALALCADASVWLATRHQSRPFIAAAAAAIAGISVLVVTGDIVWRGAGALAGKEHSNYGLDDRSSIRLLLASHRSGDAIVTTHFGLVALWWYSGLDVSNAERTGHLPDGSPLFELRHVADERDCEQASAELNSMVSGRDRIVLYLGFRHNVLPENFDKLVMRDLTRRASLVTYKAYTDVSQVAVFELRRDTQPQDVRAQDAEVPDSAGMPPGCIGVTPARRW